MSKLLDLRLKLGTLAAINLMTRMPEKFQDRKLKRTEDVQVNLAGVANAWASREDLSKGLSTTCR